MKPIYKLQKLLVATDIMGISLSQACHEAGISYWEGSNIINQYYINSNDEYDNRFTLEEKSLTCKCCEKRQVTGNRVYCKWCVTKYGYYKCRNIYWSRFFQLKNVQ